MRIDVLIVIEIELIFHAGLIRGVAVAGIFMDPASTTMVRLLTDSITYINSLIFYRGASEVFPGTSLSAAG